jgi:hypothetical protein
LYGKLAALSVDSARYDVARPEQKPFASLAGLRLVGPSLQYTADKRDSIFGVFRTRKARHGSRDFWRHLRILANSQLKASTLPRFIDKTVQKLGVEASAKSAD